MKRIVNNLPFKIISLILSIVLWLYVAGEFKQGLWWRTKNITFYGIPIRIMGLPEKEFYVDVKPDKASAMLYSYKRDVESINRDNIILFVNLSNLVPATYELPIESITPRDFNISKIEPSKVIVAIHDKEPLNPSVSDTLIQKKEEQSLHRGEFGSHQE